MKTRKKFHLFDLLHLNKVWNFVKKLVFYFHVVFFVCVCVCESINCIIFDVSLLVLNFLLNFFLKKKVRCAQWLFKIIIIFIMGHGWNAKELLIVVFFSSTLCVCICWNKYNNKKRNRFEVNEQVRMCAHKIKIIHNSTFGWNVSPLQSTRSNYSGHLKMCLRREKKKKMIKLKYAILSYTHSLHSLSLLHAHLHIRMQRNMKCSY